MQEVQQPRKFNINRRPSSNISIESAQSSPLVKKKYIMEKNDSSSKQKTHKHYLEDFALTRKLKICDGQKLSYEVIKKDSQQKRAQFLQKYTHDPFMRKKFQKSIEKLNRSNSRQTSRQKKTPSVINSSLHKIPHSQTYTTFRQQIMQQSQKTIKLINNCKQLVDELKKNRLNEAEINSDGKNGRRFSHFETRK